jgi:hypothetical protein
MVMSVAFVAAAVSQVYVPWPDWHIYLLACGVLSILVVLDAIDRQAPLSTTLLHAIGALLFAPLVVPRWYAVRPLKPGQWRKGGADTHFFMAFGVLTVVFTGISAACNFINCGPDSGFELIINAGFAVAGTAFIMSMAAHKERVFEKGPVAVREQAEKVKR